MCESAGYNFPSWFTYHYSVFDNKGRVIDSQVVVVVAVDLNMEIVISIWNQY